MVYLVRTSQVDLLSERFQRDGFVLIRGLLSPQDVYTARESALRDLSALRPEVFMRGKPPLQGLAAKGASSLGLLGVFFCITCHNA